MSIVIVDDSPAALSVLKIVAAQRGAHTVEAFEDGPGALAYLADNPAVAIVVDFSMPDMNGVELTCAVRGMAHHAQTPIIMVTAADGIEVRQAAIQAGVTHFLYKPLNLTTFKAVIKNILEPPSTIGMAG